jgi:hypothetical protein
MAPSSSPSEDETENPNTTIMQPEKQAPEVRESEQQEDVDMEDPPSEPSEDEDMEGLRSKTEPLHISSDDDQMENSDGKLLISTYRYYSLS